MNINFESSYLGDASLFDEISDDELLSGGRHVAPQAGTNILSSCIGPQPVICTVTAECQRGCN